MAPLLTTGAGSYAPVATGGGGFTPASLPGLFIWLDASDSATVIRSGANVTAWNDKSGNGVNFTATNSPQYSATGFNSLPGISTLKANSQSFISGSVSLTTTTLSWFCVGFFPSPIASTDGIFSLRGAGSANDYDNVKSWETDTGGTNTVRFISDLFATAFNVNVPSACLDAPISIGCVFDGTNGKVCKDFTFSSTAAKAGAFGNTTAVFSFFCRNGGGTPQNFSTMTAAEMVMTTSALGSTDLASLHSYFSTKWGVP